MTISNAVSATDSILAAAPCYDVEANPALSAYVRTLSEFPVGAKIVKMPHAASTPVFYEFFAGGGMARLGLGKKWKCIFANDIDKKKAEVYRANFGRRSKLHIGDISDVLLSQLEGRADLAWASFPCQDLSLAGNGAGLSGDRSGTFWSFWHLMEGLGAEKRSPRLIVLENVCGALTSHGGRDFQLIAHALQLEGYRFGALIADAVNWVPQSRPRLFIIAVHKSVKLPKPIVSRVWDEFWHPLALRRAVENCSALVKQSWLWWKIPVPVERETDLRSIIEDVPTGVSWHTSLETDRLLSLMNERHLAKIESAKVISRTNRQSVIGCVYKRMRLGKQRAEVRFDGVAGCLRTPSGGSNRQTILVIESGKVRSRLLSPREAARLMGLHDSYQLPASNNEAYHIAGDGVAVDVVRYLARHLLEPIAKHSAPA